MSCANSRRASLLLVSNSNALRGQLKKPLMKVGPPGGYSGFQVTGIIEAFFEILDS